MRIVLKVSVETAKSSLVDLNMYFNNAAWKRGWSETRETTVKGANFLVQWNWILIWQEKDFNKYIALSMKTWCSA